jgi:type I restriction-modification system DNA methylase subunit
VSKGGKVKTSAGEFQTPPEVCRYMVSLLPPGCQTILEPTPGKGNIVRYLSDYQVTAPADYFLLDKTNRFDGVVMNPPFSTGSAILDNAPAKYHNEKGMKLGYRILNDCMQMSDTIIALMPWFTLTDSDVRLRFLHKFGLRSVTALPRKTFEYSRIQTCILELNKGFTGKTMFVPYDHLPKIPCKYETQTHLTL